MWKSLRSRTAWVAVACTALIAACGGGSDEGEDGSVGLPGGLSRSYAVVPASITPVQTVAQQPYAFEVDAQGALINPIGHEFFAYSAGACAGPLGSAQAPVWETPNAVAYNDGTAKDDQVRQVAQYAEAAVLSLRARYGIEPSNGVGFDGQKVRVCTGVDGKSTSGSAGIRTLYIVAPDGGVLAGNLVFHEMVHLVQAQALNCQKQQYRWERWMTEGMALRVTGQSEPSRKQLGNLQNAFADAEGGTPFGDTWQGDWPRNDRYEGYRLAVDVVLGESGKTDQDLYAFFKHVGEKRGCPGEGMIDMNQLEAAYRAGWKQDFDAFFGLELRGQGAAGAGFWEVASKYAR